MTRKSQRATLERSLVALIAAEDIADARLITGALEREGLSVKATHVHTTQLAHADLRDADVVVVIEPESAPLEDDAYTDLRAGSPDAALVVLSSPGRTQFQALVWAGVDAVLVDPGADAIAGPVVRAVLDGYLVVPRLLQGALAPPALTPRERQMLALVVEGLTNREIAERLYLAESTVKRNLSAIFKRLGVHSRREAVAAALATDLHLQLDGEPEG